MNILGAGTQNQRLLKENERHTVLRTMGIGYIKVAQMSPRCMGGQGILDIRWVRKRQFDPQSGQKPFNITYYGGALEFIDDITPAENDGGGLVGTGMVAYVVDDKEETPPDAKSGRKTGYNREFLATHMDEGFKIINATIEKDVRSRAEAIAKRLEEERNPAPVEELVEKTEEKEAPEKEPEATEPVEKPKFTAGEQEPEAAPEEPKLAGAKPTVEAISEQKPIGNFGG